VFVPKFVPANARVVVKDTPRDDHGACARSAAVVTRRAAMAPRAPVARFGCVLPGHVVVAFLRASQENSAGAVFALRAKTTTSSEPPTRPPHIRRRAHENAMAWGTTVGVASWVNRLVSNDPGLISVTVFRGRLFGADEAAAVFEALRTNTHLVELYASGHFMDAVTAGLLAEALAVNTTLQSLCVGDECFGDAGVAALAPGIANSASLKEIDLTNKGIGDAGAAALGHALATPGGCPSLTTIALSRNETLGQEGLAAVCHGLENVALLEKLELRELNAGGVAADAIASLLAHSPALAELDLANAALDVASGDVAKLRLGLETRAKRQNAPPLSLEMDGVALGDAGAAALAGDGDTTFLKVNRLSLRGCLLGAEGGAAVARACAAVTEVLIMRDNSLGDDGARAVAAALSTTRTSAKESALRTLDLGCCGIGADGAAALAGSPGLGCLTDLCLFGNEAVGAVGLAAFANQGTGSGLSELTSLDVGGCGVDEAGLIVFCDALVSDQTVLRNLMTLVVGGNPGAQGDAWETALQRLRDARPTLDVAWRAADAGESPETRENATAMLARANESRPETGDAHDSH
jgi:Ran GTPase-activating protein (RanGAP) involved in mRNA processing and transport